MENQKMTFSLAEGLDITATNFDLLIRMVERSEDYWIIKDRESRLCYMNKAAKYYDDLPDNYDFEGKRYDEMPTPFSESADMIHATDNKIIASQNDEFALVNSVYGGKNKLIQPFIGQGMPLIKDGESIGIIVMSRKLQHCTMEHIIGKKLPEPVIFGNPDKEFTDSEFNVVFFALQSLSTKEIARRLGISPRTVNNHLSNIYDKIGVSAQNQLIAWCRQKGYDRYVPAKYLSNAPFVPLA